MIPRPAYSLIQSDNSDVLKYLMFLKQKRDGAVTGNGCADGRKKREYIMKTDALSPTISVKAVFLIVTIAAKKGCYSASVDIPCTFLQTNIHGETILVRFEGRMAEVLAMIDPNLYRPHIVVKKPVLYMEMQRALYGIMQTAVKFWDQMVAELHSLGHELNPSWV